MEAGPDALGGRDGDGVAHGRGEQVGVRPVLEHFQFDGQLGIADLPAAREAMLGDGDDLIVIRVGRVDDDQFAVVEIHRVIPRLAFGKLQRALSREQVGEQLSQEQEDQPAVREMDAGFFPGEGVAGDVRGEQVDEQQRAEQITAGQNDRDRHVPDDGADDEPAFEVTRLRQVEAFVDLRQRADEHQRDGEAQQHDRQPHRGEQFNESLNHVSPWGI